MSLRDTRDIGTAKIVMVGGGGGGASSLADLTDTSISSPSNGQVLEYNSTSSKWENKTPTGYTAGSGIDITNNAIVNTRKGALTGVIDSISSGYAHTQMTGARDTFTAGALIVVQSEASGSATNLRIQYGSQASDSQDFRFYDTAGQTTTLTIASGETINATIDPTGYRAIVLSQYKAVAVDVNTGTPTAELKKLKVGSTVYNADAIKHYSATAISSGSISVSVPNAGHLNGEIIAVNTGSYTGTTSNAWVLSLSDGMTIEALTVSKADGTAFTDAITANELLFIKCNTSNDTAVLLGIAGASGGTSDYNDLSNKPQINSVTLSGNKSLSDLSIASTTDLASKADNDIVADAFSSSAVYDTDDVVIYQGVLYKFLYPHSGAWNTSDVTAVTVSDLIESSGGGSGMPENPLATTHGGTGNADGYIRTGHKTNTTIGQGATIEGYNNTASDTYTHAEGNTTSATSAQAHSEGTLTSASGSSSHAEGYGTSASGNYTHSSGLYTVAGYEAQTTVGKYNDNKSGTLFEVGNGSESGGTVTRSNAFEVHSSGDAVVYGDIKDSSGNKYAKGDTNGVLGITKGGTGNTVGYIQTGKALNSTVGTGATIEGYDNTASGDYTHADGRDNTASGDYTHVSGRGNVAGYNYQSVAGSYNDNKSNTVFEVGNGSGTNIRSNAFEVYKGNGGISTDNGTTVFRVTQDASGNMGYYVSSASNITPVTSMAKTRYVVLSSLWSSSANSSGYYTYTITLTISNAPKLKTNYAPNVYIAGANDSTFATDAEKSAFALLDEVNLSSNTTLVLYAKTKPTTTFNIFVEGVIDPS